MTAMVAERGNLMHGPTLNRDWIGLRAKLLRDATNYYGTIPSGTTGTIKNYSGGARAIRFDADPCAHCSQALSVSGLRRGDVVIVTPPEEWPDSRGKGRSWRQKS